MLVIYLVLNYLLLFRVLNVPLPSPPLSLSLTIGTNIRCDKCSLIPKLFFTHRGKNSLGMRLFQVVDALV